MVLTRQKLKRETQTHPSGIDPAPHIGLASPRDISETEAMNRTLVSPYVHPHSCASFFFFHRSRASYLRKDLLSECEAGHLLPFTTVPDKARPSQDQGEAISADCKERSKIIPTLELVAAFKSGRGSDGTSSRSSRLDLEASPLGLEAPGDGGCQSEDASNMIEPMDPNPESPTSLNPADIASKENASPAVEREESPVRPTPNF